MKRLLFLIIVLAVSIMVCGTPQMTVPVLADEQKPAAPQPAAPEPQPDQTRAKLVAAVEEIASLDEEAGAKLGEEGLKLLQEKKYAEGAQKLIEAVRKDRSDYVSLYNLACAYSRLSEPDAAIRCLRLSVLLGFKDYAHILGDPDFEPVRNTPAFKEFFAVLQQVRARQHGIAGQQGYAEAKVWLPYRAILPAGYDGKTEYPLIVALHGFGGNMEEFSTAAGLLAATGAILVVPNAPYLVGQGRDYSGYSWVRGADDEKNEMRIRLMQRTELAARAYVEAVVADVKKEYSVDPARVYLLGYSQGAAIAYGTALTGSRSFTGLIACSGALPSGVTDADLAASRGMKCFIAHGVEDKQISITAADAAAKRLIGAGLAVDYHKYDMKHELGREPFKEIGEWIKKH